MANEVVKIKPLEGPPQMYRLRGTPEDVLALAGAEEFWRRRALRAEEKLATLQAQYDLIAGEI